MVNRRNFLTTLMATLSTSLIVNKTLANSNEWFVPTEDNPHSGTIIALPSPENWFKTIYQKSISEYINTANTISNFEQVYFAVNPEQKHLVAGKLSSNIILWDDADITDGWARDSAPLFQINNNGKIRASGFSFKGWGGKFDYSKDAKFKNFCADKLNIPMGYISPIEAEGGTFIWNKTDCFVSKESMQKGKRNNGISLADMETEIKKVLGVKNVNWTELGLTPDPVTDGHIDGMAMFTDNNEIILQTTNDKSDPNYKIIESARSVFKNAGYDIINLPLTDDVVVHINSYICNGGLIVSASGRKTDDTPLAILREAFPKRKVIPIETNALMKSGGGVHCITMQIPAV
ncbi:MAG: agmatine deiminase family protein [Alphaproteobacteria bacterium]